MGGVARGRLVVIEGIDGGGKTTLQHALAAALREDGHEVVETKEPTNGPIGQEIRRIAAEGRDRISPEDEFSLFHEDRRAHVAEIVRPALARGAVVVQDRSYHSSVAYQGQRGLDRAALLEMSREIAPSPDVLLIVDVPAESALTRIRASRGLETDGFEVLEDLRAIRDVFLGFSGAVVLDGLAPPAEVLAFALARTRALVGPSA